jgi:hypothetical protein
MISLIRGVTSGGGGTDRKLMSSAEATAGSAGGTAHEPLLPRALTRAERIDIERPCSGALSGGGTPPVTGNGPERLPEAPTCRPRWMASSWIPTSKMTADPMQRPRWKIRRSGTLLELHFSESGVTDLVWRQVRP